MYSDVAPVILSAGKSSRMGGEIPKQMMLIGGKPIIGHILNTLDKCGSANSFTRVVIGHNHQSISDYCVWGNVSVKHQEKINGNLGALEAGIYDLDERVKTILVIHGDDGLCLTPFIISNLITSHRLRDNHATLLLTNRVRPDVHKRHYELNNLGAITGMSQMTLCLGERNAFTGVYCFDANFLRQNIPQIQPEEGQEGKTTDLFPIAFSECKLGGIIAPGSWYGINNPRELEIAREYFPS